MTGASADRTTQRTKTRKAVEGADPPKANELQVDAEARALMANPALRAMLEEAKRIRPEDLISLDELNRRLGPMTETEAAFANAYLEALDRLEEEQDNEVTDTQGRLIRLVLVAAAYARGSSTVCQLSADSGFGEDRIRAVAAALRALGLQTTTAAPVARRAE